MTYSRARLQRHNPLAAARLPGEEAAAEVGDRVRDAVHARHGRRVHPLLRAAVHHGPLPVPAALGGAHRRVVVRAHLRQPGVPRDAQRSGERRFMVP